MKLRKLLDKDADRMLEWMHDKTINCYFKFDFNKMTKDKVLEFIHNSNISKDSLHMAVVNDNDEYLGTVSLKNINTSDKNAEYAICIRSDSHGMGVANFATTQILKIAFFKYNLEKVYLNVLSENIRANKFYAKYGFSYEGESKQHVFIKNKLMDLKWYAMLKKDFKL